MFQTQKFYLFLFDLKLLRLRSCDLGICRGNVEKKTDKGGGLLGLVISAWFWFVLETMKYWKIPIFLGIVQLKHNVIPTSFMHNATRFDMSWFLLVGLNI